MTREEFEASSYYQAHYAQAKTPVTEAQQKEGHWLLDWLALKPDDRVLDVGSGLGALAAAMAESGATVMGIDVSAIAVAEAQRRYPCVNFLVLDGFQLDRVFDPGSFDVITCVQILEHIPEGDVDHLISLLSKCLSVEGRLLIDVPVTDNLSDKWLMFRNEHIKGLERPPMAIDSSFNPTHLWRIGDLGTLIDRFRREGLELERMRKLYYVPWVLERSKLAFILGYLPSGLQEQFLKGSTLLFHKGAVGQPLEEIDYSAFWSESSGTKGISKLRRLLA